MISQVLCANKKKEGIIRYSCEYDFSMQMDICGSYRALDFYFWWISNVSSFKFVISPKYKEELIPIVFPIIREIIPLSFLSTSSYPAPPTLP